MNLLSLTLLATGGVLMYSAVKGYDPRDVVRAALNGQTVTNAKYVLPNSTSANTAAYTPTTTKAPKASGV